MPTMSMVKIASEFLAKLLGWIYIFAFILIVACYTYGFSRYGQSLENDEDKLTSILWLRCAIEKYIGKNGALPHSLNDKELLVGTTNSLAGWLADSSGISYREIESSSEINELICPGSNDDCEKLIANNNSPFYELCADFTMDFGDEERALVRNPTKSSFPSSESCGVGTYHVNPKHSKGKYCYIFCSPKGKKDLPSFIKKLNSYDDFYDKYPDN